MLNARPDVFVMREVWPYGPNTGHYTTKFLGMFPEARPIFFDRSVNHAMQRFKSVFSQQPNLYIQNYARLQSLLRQRGYEFRYFGDKVPTMDPRRLLQLATAPKFVFTVRDIRAWLCDSKIFLRGTTVQNVVPQVLNYLDLLIHASTLDNALILRTEDLITSNKDAAAQLIQYLDLPDSEWIDQYWEHVLVREDDPKSVCKWVDSGKRPGRSAAYKPMDIASEYELREHELWDIVLPMFEKYYDSLNKHTFNGAEIAGDRKTLHKELSKLQVPLDELYQSFRSWIFVLDESNRPVRTRVWHLNTDRRLIRPRKETAPQVDYGTARSLVSEKSLPQFLMVELEDESIMAVKHAEIFGRHQFRKTAKETATMVIRVSHETAKKLLPDLSESLDFPAPSYLYRRPGKNDWELLANDFSLNRLQDLFVVAPRATIDSVKQRALARAVDGVHLLEATGARYDLRKTRRRPFDAKEKIKLRQRGLNKAKQGVATLNALGLGYELSSPNKERPIKDRNKKKHQERDS